MEMKLTGGENRYKILKEIGKGRMGIVYLALDTKLDRKIALKTILDIKSNEEYQKRFWREIQSIAKLNHRNICTIYDWDEENHYVSMEYVEGETLENLIKNNELNIYQIIDIAIQVCDGMVKAHSNHIIHRDLKPRNLMVNEDESVKILDFGIAKNLEDIDSKITQPETIIGTACYMSPEQAMGKELDERTDIFSFGVILYEMLKKNNPFEAEYKTTVLYNIIHKDINLRGIQPGLQKILRKAMKKDKDQRYSSFKDVRLDLEWVRNKLVTTEETGINSAKKINKIKFIRTVVSVLITLFIIVFIFFKLILPSKQGYILLHTFEYVESVDIEKNFPNIFYYWNFQNYLWKVHLTYELDYLLNEALNQFEDYKTINYDFVSKLIGKDIRVLIREQKYKKADLVNILKDNNINIKYEVDGKISLLDKDYAIESQIFYIHQSVQPSTITISGRGEDSFLSEQLDKLVKRLYKKIYDKFPEKQVPVSDIFGNNWNHFESYWQALFLFKTQKYDEDSKNLFKSIESSLLLSKYYLAEIFYRLGDYSTSSEYLKEIQEKEGLLTEYWRLHVSLLKAKVGNSFIEKLKYLKKLMHKFSYEAEISYELGEAYFHVCEITQAIKYYKKAIELNPNYSDAFNHLGYCYSYIGEHDKAIDCFEENKRIKPTANAFDSLGDGQCYAGDLIQAEAMKLRALSENKGAVPWVYLSLSDIYLQKAEFVKAQKSLDEYIGLIPSIYSRIENDTRNAVALARKAYIYYLEGKYQSANEAIDESLKLLKTLKSPLPNRNAAESNWIKGLISLKLGDVAESKRQLKNLENFSKDFQEKTGNVIVTDKYKFHLEALIKEKEGFTSESKNIFIKIINMKEKLSYWFIYYNYQFFHTEYANFLLRNKDYKNALQEIEKCLKINQNYTPALWVKAKILDELHDINASKKIYQKIAEIYGKSEEKNLLRAELAEKLKMDDKNNIKDNDE